MADAEVSVVLSDDATVHALNRRYRGKDRPTDVLSFSQREPAAEGPPLPEVPGLPPVLGDVILSVVAASRQKAAHGVTLEEELALLTVHGILHLLGYEDETEAGAQRMRLREQAILQG